MCGIGGIFSNTYSIVQKQDFANRMASSMQHRGPDASSIFVDEKIALAATRLSIVDRNYKGPLIWNENETAVIVHNGEIYNYLDLRKELENKHIFRTKTDTEVIIHLIDEYGINGVNKLNGDYSFALWNTYKNVGYLVRDRMGVKPLYYAWIKDTLVFASEIKAILICFPELAEVDSLAVYDYFTFRYVPGPRTIFKDVMKLEPGAWLRFDEKGTSTKRYWEVQFPRQKSTFSEDIAIETGRDLLTKAVVDRLPGEVNYGILLSGGVDSSLITAIASEYAYQKPSTFSIIYDESQYGEYSEHEYSRKIAKEFDTYHSELLVTPETFRESICRAIYHMEEPVADPPAVLLGLICKEAHQSVNVLLSGEGADELYGGYYVYSDLLKTKEVYTGMGRLLTDPDKNALLSDEFLRSIEQISIKPNRMILKNNPKPIIQDRLQEMLYKDLNYWLPDDLLLKADKMGMMSSVEIRVPYLDFEFIEFSCSIPSKFKIQGDINKYLLRKIAETYLPPEITQQAKRGFPLPLGTWLKGPLSTWVTELILFQLSKRGYFNPLNLESLLKNYMEGTKSRFLDHVIWSMITLELFLQGVQDPFQK